MKYKIDIKFEYLYNRIKSIKSINNTFYILIIFLIGFIISIQIWNFYYANLELYFYHDDWEYLFQVININRDFFQIFIQPTINVIYRPIVLLIYFIGYYNFGLDPTFFANLIKINLLIIAILLFFIGYELKGSITGLFAMLFFFIFNVFRIDIIWIPHGITRSTSYVFFLSSLFFFIKFAKNNKGKKKILYGCLSFILGIFAFLTFEFMIILPIVDLILIITSYRNKTNFIFNGIYLFIGFFTVFIMPKYLFFNSSTYAISPVFSWTDIYNLNVFINRILTNFDFYFSNFLTFFGSITILFFIFLIVFFYTKSNMKEYLLLFGWFCMSFFIILSLNYHEHRYMFDICLPFCLVFSLSINNALKPFFNLIQRQYFKIKYRIRHFGVFSKKTEYSKICLGLFFTTFLFFSVIDTNNKYIAGKETVDIHNKGLIAIENNAKIIVYYLQTFPYSANIYFQPHWLLGIRSYTFLDYILFCINRTDINVIHVDFTQSPKFYKTGYIIGYLYVKKLIQRRWFYSNGMIYLYKVK